MKPVPIGTALAALALALPARAQMVDHDAFHNEVVALYPADWETRDPAKLDAFTSRIADDPAAYLPLVRAELARADAPNPFLYDGAVSLWLASRDGADHALLAEVLARLDPAGMQCGPLTQMAILLGSEKIDAHAAALKLLDCPDGEVVIDTGLHVLFWDRVEAFEFALFTMPDDLFLDSLIARLPGETDPYRLTMLIHAIWTTASPKGDAALDAYASGNEGPGEARAYAMEMLGHQGDNANVTASREELYAERRRIAASPYSHGSYQRFHALTDDMVTLQRRSPPPAEGEN